MLRKLLFPLLLFLLFVPAPLAAQTIRGQLIEQGTGSAINGALVVLLDESGSQRAGSLTDPAGRFQIQVPGAGRYRLRAERIGYRSTHSSLLTITSDQVLEHRLEAAASAISLAGVQVTAQRRCFSRPQDGLLVATLWEEARKALNAAAWTEREGLVRYRAVRYERELEPRTLRVASERTRSWWGGNTSPFTSRPAAELIRDGYVRVVGDSIVFYAPDAEVLLSNEFLDNYCFRVVEEKDGLVGVGFEPVGRNARADVRGVLWIDRNSAELRHLEYQYTRLPSGDRTDRAGGEVQFQRLPNGAWIVQRWQIRMPQLVEEVSRVGTADIRRQVAARYREEGGEVVEIQSGSGVRLAQAGRAVLEGIVFDSLSHAPLAEATVILDGTSYSVTTDGEGRFRMEDLPSGTYMAAFLHPVLDSLNLLPPRREVQLTIGSTAQVELAVPSAMGILAAGCPAEQRSLGTGVVVGVVRNTGTGLPLSGAEVILSWQGGRASARTDVDGAYRFCVAPLGVALTVQPQIPRGYSVEHSGPGEKVAVSLDAEGVVHQDLALRLVQTVARSPQQAFATTTGRTEIRGQLLDAESGQPIQGAVVQVRGQDTRRTTDRQGRFTLGDLRPDRYTLEVEHLAYGTQAETIAIGAPGIVEVELRLAQQAVELRGLEVRVLAAREEMRRRSGTRLDLFTRTELEEFERTAHHVGDVVRRIPGVRVREVLDWGGGRRSLCIESTRSAPAEIPPPPCRPVKVYFDDMWMRDGAEFLLTISLNQLESVQYIPGITALSRYGTGAENGVLLLYTRGNGPTARGSRD